VALGGAFSPRHRWPPFEEHAMRSKTLPIILTLAAACIAEPSAAQDARACTNEVQRLSEGFPAAGGSTQSPAVSAQQPGARVDAGTDETQQRQIRGMMQEARTAGEQGNGPLCMQNLNKARTMLRQAGVGSGQPGIVTPGGQGTPDSGDASPNLQGTQAPPGARGPASATPGAADTTGGTGATGAPMPQGAETPQAPTAGTPSRNTRDSAVSPGGTGNSTTRGTTSGAGGAGGSTGGGGR
jgi:hypothetical protein